MAGRKPTYFVITGSGAVSKLMSRRAARDFAKTLAKAQRHTVPIYQFDSGAGTAVEIAVAFYWCRTEWHDKPKFVPAILAATIKAHFDSAIAAADVEMGSATVKSVEMGPV